MEYKTHLGKIKIQELALEVKAKDDDLNTSPMVIDVNTIKNEHEPSDTFKDQTLGDADAKVTKVRTNYVTVLFPSQPVTM